MRDPETGIPVTAFVSVAARPQDWLLMWCCLLLHLAPDAFGNVMANMYVCFFTICMYVCMLFYRRQLSWFWVHLLRLLRGSWCFDWGNEWSGTVVYHCWCVNGLAEAAYPDPVFCCVRQYLCNRAISVSYAFKKDTKGERHGTPAERLLAAQQRANMAHENRPHTMFATAPRQVPQPGLCAGGIC